MGCYTCRLPPQAQDLVFCDMRHGRFHFDLKGRPLVIYTPYIHKTTTMELSPDELYVSFREIDAFMSDVGLPNYQVSMSFGGWLQHAHVHWKIRADEVSILALRAQHLGRVASRRTLWPHERSKSVSDGCENRGQGRTGVVGDHSQGQAAA